MKWLFLLFLSFLSAVVAQNPDCESACPEPKKLWNAACTGFQVRDQDFWDDHSVWEANDEGEFECIEASEADTVDFNSNYLCCAENEDDCCEDYPGGFYAGFGIGVGGIALMVLYAVYLCVGSSGKKPEES